MVKPAIVTPALSLNSSYKRSGEAGRGGAAMLSQGRPGALVGDSSRQQARNLLNLRLDHGSSALKTVKKS